MKPPSIFQLPTPHRCNDDAPNTCLAIVHCTNCGFTGRYPDHQPNIACIYDWDYINHPSLTLFCYCSCPNPCNLQTPQPIQSNFLCSGAQRNKCPFCICPARIQHLLIHPLAFDPLDIAT